MAANKWRTRLVASRGHRWHRPPLSSSAGRFSLQLRGLLPVASLVLLALTLCSGDQLQDPASPNSTSTPVSITTTTATTTTTRSPAPSVQPRQQATRGARRIALQDMSNSDNEHLSQLDPMEPCYLANNRASETLTISESTPVGTVVGELMVSSNLCELVSG